MNLSSANKELRIQKLPIAFRPNSAPSGIYAINVDITDMYRVISVMRKHGFMRTETFNSVSADFMVCFRKARY